MKPPKPFPTPKRKSKRLHRRKPVTLCAAGISRRDFGSSIFVISDMKLSFWNGAFSGDRMATKVKSINDSWLAMIGGDVSAMVPFLGAIEDAAQKDSKNTLRNFARLCSRTYREERKKIIETEILSQYDIGSYDEYRNLKHTEANLFEAITKEIKAAEENWFLLFCGFDHEREPHIFIISENGKIQFCDTEGFAAIGLGASAFIVSMTAYPFNSWRQAGEILYGMLAAKFSAEEAAEGVGKETQVLHLSSDSRVVPAIDPEVVETTREKWKALPKIPVGCAEELDSIVTAIVKLDRTVPYRRPRKGSKRKRSMF